MQRRISSFVVAVVLTISSSIVLSSQAYAGSTRTDGASVRRPHWYTLRLADIVVEGDRSTSPAAPVAQTVPVAEPSRRQVVHTEVASNRSYMGTIAMSALAGAVLGVLVGGAIYYLAEDQRARDIVYWGAGGVLVGAAVGVTQVMIQESRTSAAVSRDFRGDPAPTFRLALYQTRF